MPSSSNPGEILYYRHRLRTLGCYNVSIGIDDTGPFCQVWWSTGTLTADVTGRASMEGSVGDAMADAERRLMTEIKDKYPTLVMPELP